MAVIGLCDFLKMLQRNPHSPLIVYKLIKIYLSI